MSQLAPIQDWPAKLWRTTRTDPLHQHSQDFATRCWGNSLCQDLLYTKIYSMPNFKKIFLDSKHSEDLKGFQEILCQDYLKICIFVEVEEMISTSILDLRLKLFSKICWWDFRSRKNSLCQEKSDDIFVGLKKIFCQEENPMSICVEESLEKFLSAQHSRYFYLIGFQNQTP